MVAFAISKSYDNFKIDEISLRSVNKFKRFLKQVEKVYW